MSHDPLGKAFHFRRHDGEKVLFMAVAADLSNLARQLHALRRDRGWSQPDLAKKVGASAAMIGRYERGEMTPAVDVVAKLAAAFDVTMDHLYHGSGVATPAQDKVMLARWDAINSLPDADREFVLAAIDALVRDAKARRAYGQG